MWIQSNNWLVHFGFTNLHLPIDLKTQDSNATEMQQPSTTPLSLASCPASPSSFTILMLVFAVDWKKVSALTVPCRETTSTPPLAPDALVEALRTDRRRLRCHKTAHLEVLGTLHPNDGLRHQPAACRPVCKAALSPQRTTGLWSFPCHTSAWV